MGWNRLLLKFYCVIPENEIKFLNLTVRPDPNPTVTNGEKLVDLYSLWVRNQENYVGCEGSSGPESRKLVANTCLCWSIFVPISQLLAHKPLCCLKDQVLPCEKNCNLLCFKPVCTDSSKEMSAMSLGFIEVFVVLTIKLWFFKAVKLLLTCILHYLIPQELPVTVGYVMYGLVQKS